MVSRLVPRSSAAQLGILLQHARFGCSKIIEIRHNEIDVLLCDTGKRATFTRQAVEGPDFQRLRLSTGDLAIGPRGACDIVHALPAENSDEPLLYSVTYREDGLAARVSEVALTPLAQGLGDSLERRLREGRVDPYALFHARHKLLIALSRMNRQVGGLHALLASRVDLHPHQAFVAGTVILDPIRRYILADEVGLGKTIEAGIILHDLLARRSDARILILTPGPLCRQWLCEMHSSFGGQGFRLADLHPLENINLDKWQRVICSTGLALAAIEDDLLDAQWDMVIIDEVHHLLNAPHLYQLVQALSRECRDLLLLSAVPMRRREEELFKLLALLEPDLYSADGRGEAEFLEIYNAQEALGRRLNLLSGDLKDLEQGEASAEDVADRLDRLLSVPILADDAELTALRQAIALEPQHAGALGARFHMAVSDRYRVNRRLLRNRRERLISEDRLTAIRRTGAIKNYRPDQVEVDAVDAVERLLVDVYARTDVELEVRRTLAQILLQATASPDATTAVLKQLAAAKPAKVNSYGLEMLGGVVGLGGESWARVLETVCAGAVGYLDAGLLRDAQEANRRWLQSPASRERWSILVDYLRDAIARGEKTLVFLGFPGAAASLVAYLQEAIGSSVLTEFRTELDDMVKEENVRRFRSEATTLVMVSDESGGEGRNFQFAHGLVHVDLPWQAAVIEQRIGRLDRLGREAVSTEVPSIVLCNELSLEAGLAHCYADGLALFRRSLSGLEFALRRLQDLMLDTALSEGPDALFALAPALAEGAAEERMRDESEALLDEASYHAGRAERFLRVSGDDVESVFETSFTSYVKQISNKNAVWTHATREHQSGLWGFRPDEIRNGEVAITDRDQAGSLGKRIGTFRRAIAQTRRDVEFFNYGNPLVDAVVHALTEKLTGRTYAIAVTAAGHSKFVGIEAVITARPSGDEGEMSPSLLNLADALFGYRRRPVFVPLNPEANVDGQGLADLRGSLNPDGTGARWSALGLDDMRRFAERELGDLDDCLRRLFEVEVPKAKEQIAAGLEEGLAAERQRIASNLEYLRRHAAEASAFEITELERYDAVIANWSIQIDGLGFLAVNAGR